MSIYLDIVFNLPIRKTFTYIASQDQVIDLGQRVIAPFKNKTLTGYVIDKKKNPPAGITGIKEIKRVIDKLPVFDKKVLELAYWISKIYMCSLGEALSAILPGGKKEVQLDYIFDPVSENNKKSYNLSEEQKNAIESILKEKKGEFYLYGVTGSGKTEVYINVAKEIIADNRGVIYLVPEISLAHQVVECLSQEFKKVAILHSGLTASQRLKEWMRIFKGEVNIVIGVRSAVFAPLRNLGLIIVDEEHEGSYKSSSTPRYHARQVAIYRCREEKAICIMGSATPSIEAYYRMKTGKLFSFILSERLSGGKMPEVHIVDMKQENSTFSKKLVEEMKRTHALGRQTILFLNRRGFAYYFHCHSCGYEMKCRNCSVTLTFHKKKWKMICHYCGYSIRPIELCPTCGSLDVGYSGFGTERIEEDIQKIFPNFTIKRIDTDTVRNKKKLKSILVDFRKGRIDILLGTQMVAKGLNFPRVMLVGIISADTGLNLPDFRAAERTFSLIVQVSGRAGRMIPDGKVIIQTYKPDNEAVRLAANMKLDEYYDNELAVRKELGFPPFIRLIRIVFRGKDEDKTFNTAKMFYKLINNGNKDIDFEILGPSECPIGVLSGNFRFQLIFRARTFSRFHNYLKSLLLSFKPLQSVYLEVDIDPISLL